ncbi:hypothetical protein EDD22DRAFT_853008 [Suillus occidentalis]|nr:hypothetical protein EDD22DRAFT_853008 [Suillus occidentalis]
MSNPTSLPALILWNSCDRVDFKINLSWVGTCHIVIALLVMSVTPTSVGFGPQLYCHINVWQASWSLRILMKKRNLNCGENTDREMNAGTKTYVQRARCGEWLWADVHEIRTSARCKVTHEAKMRARLWWAKIEVHSAQLKQISGLYCAVGVCRTECVNQMPVGHGWMDGWACESHDCVGITREAYL